MSFSNSEALQGETSEPGYFLADKDGCTRKTYTVKGYLEGEGADDREIDICGQAVEQSGRRYIPAGTPCWDINYRRVSGHFSSDGTSRSGLRLWYDIVGIVYEDTDLDSDGKAVASLVTNGIIYKDQVLEPNVRENVYSKSGEITNILSDDNTTIEIVAHGRFKEVETTNDVERPSDFDI